MNKKYREIEINLVTSNDVEFVKDVLKNDGILLEMYSNEEDAYFLTAVLYVDEDDVEALYGEYPVLRDVYHDDYELDDESIDALRATRHATIDDIDELGEVYDKFEDLITRYRVS